ncbi:hypothetical protein [Aquabacterium sp. OR-4]|uniref:hypothetical protein n=1 Tax=Aquabacterium sp. OR-4 TaxID=2978127 RepID=UPI0028CACE5F|nr:hypothetical protein [Aquabacterium sp. OR-4]MDT7836505.1 hypothetical protein [Aquabacterium sp. OR-4]
MAFAPIERQRLMVARGLGPRVLERLEQVGLDSLDKLRAVGAEQAVERICAQQAGTAWRNRRRALAQALAGTLG